MRFWPQRLVFGQQAFGVRHGIKLAAAGNYNDPWVELGPGNSRKQIRGPDDVRRIHLADVSVSRCRNAGKVYDGSRPAPTQRLRNCVEIAKVDIKIAITIAPISEGDDLMSVLAQACG